jgi:hypothetical protein
MADTNVQHFDVGMSVRGGWVELRLAHRASRCTIAATTIAMGDAVSELTASLIAIATGRIDACCAWPGEPRGAFIDLSRRPGDTVAIAVQETVDVGGPTVNENMAEWLRGLEPDELRAARDFPWLPVRGRLLFGARPPAKVLLAAFWSALVRAETAVPNQTYEAHWGHPFPAALIRRLGESI